MLGKLAVLLKWIYIYIIKQQIRNEQFFFTHLPYFVGLNSDSCQKKYVKLLPFRI